MRQHIISLVLAIAAGLLAFLILYQGTSYFLDRYLENSGYYASHEKQYVESLQEYVQENGLASTDSDALSNWGKQQGDLFFQIYDGEKLLFQYYNRGSESFREAVSLSFLEWIAPYELQFTDGTYEAIIFGDYYYKRFKYTMVIDFLGAFAIFLIVFLPGIRRRTKYITQLRDEIEILGSGDLDYEITVKGNDELTDLADNLDQMRRALKHHMNEESRLEEERRTIVTKLSHDIRTPLTSMSLFAGLLKRGDYQDEAQRDHYLDRIQENADNLSNLAEELFNAATNSGQTSKAEEKPTGLNLIPLLADEAESLKISGFTVQEDYVANEQMVAVDKQVFIRILDNIISNIQRYADPCEPILISTKLNAEEVIVAFENTISQDSSDAGGSGIGLQNVRELMQKQGGTVDTEDTDNRFVIRLRFPVKG